MGNLRKMSSLRQVVSDLNMELAAFEASLNNEFDEASFSKPAQCRVQKQPAATTQNEDRDFEVDFQGLRHEDKRSKHPTDARSQPIQARCDVHFLLPVATNHKHFLEMACPKQPSKPFPHRLTHQAHCIPRLSMAPQVG